MPLEEGSDQDTISRNIRELHHANKDRSKPRSNDQIVAIAMSKAGKSNKMTESLQDFILSLSTPENSNLVEGAIMNGFTAIFEEEADIGLPETPKGLNDYQNEIKNMEKYQMAATRAAQELDQAKKQTTDKLKQIKETEVAERASRGLTPANVARDQALAQARGTGTNSATSSATSSASNPI